MKDLINNKIDEIKEKIDFLERLCNSRASLYEKFCYESELDELKYEIRLLRSANGEEEYI